MVIGEERAAGGINSMVSHDQTFLRAVELCLSNNFKRNLRHAMLGASCHLFQFCCAEQE